MAWYEHQILYITVSVNLSIVGYHRLYFFISERSEPGIWRALSLFVVNL